MLKFVAILMALIPVYLFVRARLARSTALTRAVSDLRRQIDYVVWVMLLLIAIAVVYSIVSLLLPLPR